MMVRLNYRMDQIAFGNLPWSGVLCSLADRVANRLAWGLENFNELSKIGVMSCRVWGDLPDGAL